MKTPIHKLLEKLLAAMRGLGRREFLSSAFSAFVLFTTCLLAIGVVDPRHALAQSRDAELLLPMRIFDMSQDHLTKLIIEVQASDEVTPKFEHIQYLRQLYDLVAQIKQYRSAMLTIGPSTDNNTYIKISNFDNRLIESGITPESIALKGLRAIDSGDWSKLTPREMGKLEVTSATFVGGVNDPVLAANANLHLGRVFGVLGKNSISFDRIRDATELTEKIAAPDARIEIQLKLAKLIVKLTDQRRFGLLTLLVRKNSVLLQQKIIDIISENWASVPTAVGLPKDIWDVWAQRIENHRNPVSAVKYSEQLEHCAKFIDTNFCLVLLAGYQPIKQNRASLDLVRNYIAQDKGLKALQLLSSLSSESIDLQANLELMNYFSNRDHTMIASRIAEELENRLKANPTKLDVPQQSMLSTALARAGLANVLQELFEIGILSVDVLDRDRSIAVANINKALNELDSGTIVPKVEVQETFKDLMALASLIQGSAFEIGPDFIIHEDMDLAVWVRAGRLLWKERARRSSVVEFESGLAPAALKLALARGVTMSDSFHIQQDAGKKLVEALAASGNLEKINGARSLDAILVAASVGQKIVDKDEISTLTAKSNIQLEYNKRTLRFLAQHFPETDFLSQTAKLRKITNYRERVSAFRALADFRAEQLDEARWLSQSDVTATVFKPAAAASIVQNDGSPSLSNELVNINYTNEELLRNAATSPDMPNHYPGSSDIYVKLPMPIDGAADATIGGEGRVDRLTRLSSEHYKGATNLGVRDHVYAASGNITPKFIFVREGVLSMGQILAKIGHFNSEMIAEIDGNIVLQAPIIVGPDATLVVSGEEFKQLRLSRQKGAFIINAGSIYFSDIEVVGFDEVAQKPATLPIGNPGTDFRPFILSLSASQTFAANSKFEALGYSAGSAYGFSLSLGPADDILKRTRPAAPTGLIVDSSFENLYYGFYAFEAKDVKLVGNEYRDGIVYGLDPHDRSFNLLMAFNSAYGTHKKHGIIISREVDDSFIIGNMSFDNAGTGIMLDRDSMGTIVYANTLMNNKGDGFATLESPCALISRNNIEANGRIGIKVRNSWDIHIESNIVRGNSGAAIEGYSDVLEEAKGSEARNFKLDPYLPVATMTVVRNQLQENPTAIHTQGVAATTLFDNEFIYQAPKLFAGDAKNLDLDIFVKSSERPITLVSTCFPKIVSRKKCSLVEKGIIWGHSNNLSFAARSSDPRRCLVKKGAAEIAPMNSEN